MKDYEAPELLLSAFLCQDVLATSGKINPVDDNGAEYEDDDELNTFE